MKFTKDQLNYFGAEDGAWSAVTSDERHKGQITITDADGEAEIVIQALGRRNIPRSPATGRTQVSMFKRNGDVIGGELKINFPKQGKDELRIYRNTKAGFDYENGDVWFVFRKGDQLTVGSFPAAKWHALGREDKEDAEFQDEIEKAIAGESLDDIYFETSGGVRIRRDPMVAVAAIQSAGYRCEYDPKTRLFISRATGEFYVEAHHFIPLSASRFVSGKLDIRENIVSLSPHWHRAIHHAESETARRVIQRLAAADSRQELLRKKNVSIRDLFDFYGL